MHEPFDTFREALGVALRRARLRKGYTQAELGAKTGRTQSAIGKLERGPLPGVSLNVLYEICAAIPVPLIEVFTEADKLSHKQSAKPSVGSLVASIDRLPEERRLSVCRIIEEALTLAPPQ